MNFKVVILLVTIGIVVLHAAPSEEVHGIENKTINEEQNAPSADQEIDNQSDENLVASKIEGRAGQTEAPANGISESFRNFTSQIGNGVSGATNGIQQLFQNATGGLNPSKAPSPEQAKLIFDGSSKLIIPLGDAADGMKRFFDFMKLLPIGN